MVTDIRLQHFRSYEDESFEFDDGVNIIVGPNASGKTNLLEAILMICRGSSYRAKDGDTIKYQEPWARLDAHIGTSSRSVKLARSDDGATTKTLLIGDHSFRRLSLPRMIPIVLFEPQHLALLTGPPELRRTFIDDLLEQMVVSFGATRRQYKRALAQRNALLKSNQTQAIRQMFAWNIRLSELGGQIVDERRRMLGVLNTQLADLYSEIAHSKSQVQLIYQSSWSQSDKSGHYGSQLLSRLESGMALDLERGFTACGPHREDFIPYLNGRRIAETASRGEIRSLLLALKILEMRLLQEARGTNPVLLLDDVFSELDGARRRALTRFLQPYQTFITTTDADVVVQHFMKDCHIIPLNQPTS